MILRYVKAFLCDVLERSRMVQFWLKGDSLIKQLIVASFPYIALYVLRFVGFAISLFGEMMKSRLRRAFGIAPKPENPFLLDIQHYTSKRRRFLIFSENDMVLLCLAVAWRAILCMLDCYNACLSQKYFYYCTRTYPVDRGMPSLLFCATILILSLIFKGVYLLKAKDQTLFVGPLRSLDLQHVGIKHNVEVVLFHSKVFYAFEYPDYLSICHIIVWFPILSYVPYDKLPAAEDYNFEINVKFFAVVFVALVHYVHLNILFKKVLDIELQLDNKREEQI
jgi:hypothetical protein